MISIAKWLTIVYRGVWLNSVMHVYQDVTPTRREFIFYGIQIKWVMIGVTIVKKVPE
jgi:hypothetical protein